MLYIVFQYGRELVLIQQKLIGFEAILEIFLPGVPNFSSLSLSPCLIAIILSAMVLIQPFHSAYNSASYNNISKFIKDWENSSS